MSVRTKRHFLLAFLILVPALAFCECDVASDVASAKQLLLSKDYDRAVITLNKLSRCGTLSPLESFELAWLYGRARHFSEALHLFKSLPVDVPDRASHAYAVALTSFELSDFKTTAETLEALASHDQLNADSANLLAVAYSKLGFYGKAEVILTKQTETGPDNLPAYLNLVTLYADQDKFEEAAAVASHAVALFPESPEVLIVSGAANTLTGKLEEAHEDFSRAAKLSPTKADPRFFLALTEYKQGDFARAIQSLKEATNSGVTDSDLHYLLAECLLKVDGPNKVPAMKELDKALALNAGSVSARCLRGKLLLDSGHAAEAASDLERAYQKDPDSRTAAYNLARAYQRLGKKAEAQVLFAHLRGGGSDSLSEMSLQRLNSALSGGKQEP
jgi:tetratricopeptide (TPR) repeat protein